jgi:hypothetical protein
MTLLVTFSQILFGKFGSLPLPLPLQRGRGMDGRDG